MARNLRQVDWGALVHAEPFLDEVHRRAGHAGLEALLVGGAVRDALLGRPPRDLDLVLVGNENSAVALLEKMAGDHGCRVLNFDHRGLRERRLPLAGREMDFVLVPAGGREQELRRRDFTINALAAPLAGGALLDEAGGAADLAAGVLRQVSPASIPDDPLRGLRAIRLMAEDPQLRLEDVTAAAIRAAAPATAACAGERIGAEMNRLAASGRFATAMESMLALELLESLAPEAAATRGVGQNEFHHLDVWDHTLAALRLTDDVEALAASAGGAAARPESPLAEDLLILRYAAFFHDLGKVATRSQGDDGRIHFYGHEKVSATLAGRVCRRWHFSQKRIQRLAVLVLNHLRPGALGTGASERAARRLVHDAGADLDLLLLLSLADTGATGGVDHAARLRDLRHICGRLRQLYLRLGEDLIRPRPLLSGNDIMALLGMPPGPRVGRLLQELLRLQVEGDVSTRDEAEAVVRRLAGQM